MGRWHDEPDADRGSEIRQHAGARRRLWVPTARDKINEKLQIENDRLKANLDAIAGGNALEIEKARARAKQRHGPRRMKSPTLKKLVEAAKKEVAADRRRFARKEAGR